MPAKYKLLACEVMRDEVEALLAESGRRDDYDIAWMEMGLHEKPERLKAELARQLSAIKNGHQAVLLMFGLCSNATAGLTPPPGTVLVIPRVHDCISVYLGSADAYRREMEKESGTYWFSRGFLHRSDGRSPDMGGFGAGSAALLGDDGEPTSLAEMRQRFSDQYGEENADYLMETLVESWKKNYRRAVHLTWDANPEAGADYRRVADFAAENDWTCESRPVDFRLLRGLLFGPWPEGEFAVVRHGERVAATHDHLALRAEPSPAP